MVVLTTMLIPLCPVPHTFRQGLLPARPLAPAASQGAHPRVGGAASVDEEGLSRYSKRSTGRTAGVWRWWHSVEGGTRAREKETNRQQREKTNQKRAKTRRAAGVQPHHRTVANSLAANLGERDPPRRDPTPASGGERLSAPPAPPPPPVSPPPVPPTAAVGVVGKLLILSLAKGLDWNG